MAKEVEITLYQGEEGSLPSLVAGEPAFTTDTYELWMGSGAGNKQVGGAQVVIDVASNNSHRADTANPHATDVENLGAGTLAELNGAISDETIPSKGYVDTNRPVNIAINGAFAYGLFYSSQKFAYNYADGEEMAAGWDMYKSGTGYLAPISGCSLSEDPLSTPGYGSQMRIDGDTAFNGEFGVRQRKTGYSYDFYTGYVSALVRVTQVNASPDAYIRITDTQGSTSTALTGVGDFLVTRLIDNTAFGDVDIEIYIVGDGSNPASQRIKIGWVQIFQSQSDPTGLDVDAIEGYYLSPYDSMLNSIPRPSDPGDPISKQYADARPGLVNLIRNGTFQDWVDTSVAANTQEGPTEWFTNGLTSAAALLTRVTTGAVIGDYALKILKQATADTLFYVRQTVSYLAEYQRFEGCKIYFVVHVVDYNVTGAGNWNIEPYIGAAATFITGTGTFVAEGTLNGSTGITLNIKGAALDNGDYIVIDWAQCFIVDEANGPALDVDLIARLGYIPSSWDTTVQIRMGTYTGNNANSRLIETGIEFDEAEVYRLDNYNYTSYAMAYGWYKKGLHGNLVNSPPGNAYVYSQAGSTANSYFQGRSGTKLYCGSSGAAQQGTNYTGWQYVWIAKRVNSMGAFTA